MDTILNNLENNKQFVSIVGGLAVGGVAAIYVWRRYKSQPVLHKKNYKRDVVYLYQYPSIKTISSLSPFALKLESWLRLKNIPYEDSRGYKTSSVGLVPFVEFNGREITDSNLIISKLSEHFYMHETELSPYERGVTRAVSMMLDQQTTFSYGYYRWCMDIDSFMDCFNGISALKRIAIKCHYPKLLKTKGYYTSLGRLPDSEILQFGFQDLRALSQILGDKDFIHGDEPTLADCHAFSHLAQLLYLPVDYPHTKYIRVNCPNLIDYAERFKQRVWPDWDRVCNKNCLKS